MGLYSRYIGCIPVFSLCTRYTGYIQACAYTVHSLYTRYMGCIPYISGIQPIHPILGPTAVHRAIYPVFSLYTGYRG